MSKILLVVLIAALGLGAYFLMGSSDSPSPLEGAAPDVAAADPGRPRLHPLEAWCVDYVLEGMMQGTWKECGRAHGYERFEIQNVEIKLGGFTQSNRKRVVYLEDEIYTIASGRATMTKDPQFEARIRALAHTDPKQVLDDFVAAMGYTLTAESRTIAGNDCRVATGPIGTLCITDDALVLHMDAMGQVRRATAVSRGESGDPQNYAVPDDVAEGPDLSNIEELMKGMRPPR